MIFIGIIMGYFFGEFIIGGILFALFGKSETPNKTEDKTFTVIGKIIGVISAYLIFNS